MSVTVAIRHHTKYIYERPIRLYPQVIRLRPSPHSRTAIKSYQLKVTPENHYFNWVQDPFGNYQARVVFNELVKEFSIQVELIVEMIPVNPFDFFVEEYAAQFPFAYDEELLKELQPYLEIEEVGEKLKQCISECKKFTNQNTLDFLVAINQYLFEKIKYESRLETGVQTCEETLEKESGSCRDSAWLLVQLLRNLGLGARFVSGYLVQLKAEEGSEKGPKEDTTDLHAWAEVYLPGAGWIGLDVTSGLLTGEGHIALACTPSFERAAPVTGMVELAEVTFEFENSVERI